MICPHCQHDTETPPKYLKMAERIDCTCSSDPLGRCTVHPANQWFDAFWSLYPRKVAKASALKAWKKVCTSEAVKDAIMAGLKRQLAAWGILDPATMKYVPHASTWLNNKRWDDELAGTKNTAKRVIACEKCEDTGTVALRTTPTECDLWRCSCPRGQLPDLMVGTFSLETGELISNETPQDGVI